MIPSPLPSPAPCLAGGGETGALMRALDWSQNPLGPAEAWPKSLQTLVSTMLASRFAMRILWGPSYIVLYNDAYRPILGPLKHPGAMGRPMRESYREVWSVVEPMFERVYRGEAHAQDDMLLFLDRSGYREEAYFTISYSPINDDQGKVGGMLGVVHETTERVLAERRLRVMRELASATSKARTSEEACEAAAGVLRDNPADVPFSLFYLFEDDGRRSRLAGATGLAPGFKAAPASVDLDEGAAMGWPLAELRESGALVVVGDVHARFGDVRAPHGGEQGDPVGSALVLPLKRSGAERPHGALVAGVNPRRVLDEKYLGFFELTAEHVGSAISNAVAYAEERRRAEALASIDQQKTAFFGNVSHEFRTPLTLMLGPLADALASPERALRGAPLEAAHRNALRLLKLVNSLLEISRIEAGRMRVDYRATDLAALTRDLAHAFDGLSEKAGLRLTIDCPDLGAPAYLDPSMWEKIVLNLLSNAFKFTFEGAIGVRLLRAGDDVELQVEDTGTGIAPADVQHLFERFHRVLGARARTHEGSGIGLALVQELVRLHGGAVAVDSAPGRGTTFAVRIPLGHADLAARADEPLPADARGLGFAPYVEEAARWLDPRLAAAEALPKVPAPDALPTAHVLLVDDSADMRAYVSGVLQPYFVVEVAVDGEDALHRLKRAVPDLVLTDVMMPKLDGFGLLQAIRSDERTRATPVVLLSARAGEESRVDGINAGADDYLTKPFSAKELLARVRMHIELGRLRSRVEAERRAAAEAERARIYGLFTQAPAAICVLRGPTHVFELANPPYEKLMGRGALHGLPLKEALPEVAPRVLPLLDRVYATGETFFADELQIPVEREGGVTDAYFNFVYKPTVDAAGQVEGIAVVASEVTEQVRSRKVAEGLSQALATSNRDLDQFAHVASHDLKAPLRGIANLSQWIEEALTGKMEDETKDHMRLLRGRVHRMDALIDGILSYSRAGRSRDRAETLDVGALLAETRDLLAPPPGVRVILEGPMPLVKAERVPFQQVFLNLLGNALKHAHRSDPEVVISCAEEAGFFHFRVRDNGRGIAPEYHERIWAIFTTLEARDQVEGTGIGLALVKKIVEARGGRVRVESALGEGATFHVEWPKQAAAATALFRANVD